MIVEWKLYKTFLGPIQLILFFFILTACEQDPVFTLLPPETTGVDFVNAVAESDSVDVSSHPFLYNGGGVAIGDINNDGLPDVYLIGNQVSSRLYLNQGNMRFKDITASSGTGTRRWASGAAMVDINHDGYLDIYISVTGGPGTDDASRANLLYLNNGDNTFREAAEEFGLADTGYTVQAAFFDYDLDGDLDVYLLNNYEKDFLRENTIRAKNDDPNSPRLDAFYRNNGDGTFTNVSRDAGITKEGYGLGIAVNDINNDGWPDVYISNDILTNDQLYVNNGDGTFTDMIAEWLNHTSYSGMGVDMADFNNDGWVDIVQVDMLPETEEEIEKTLINHGYSQYEKLQKLGYSPQYMYNTLQMNRGKYSYDNMIFSEISQKAGVQATGWSWAALLEDFNNDGHPDLLVTNGYPKNLISLDYFNALNDFGPFGTPESRRTRKRELLDELESLKLVNKLFENNGDLTFTDKSGYWGFDIPSYSYGAAASDLDGDGDLDLVISNLNDSPFIYQNQSINESGSRKQGSNFFQVKVIGPEKNPGSIGTKLKLVAGDTRQYQYISPYRGYISSNDNVAHFGLKERNRIDSLVVSWPGGSESILLNMSANQQITMHYSDKDDQEKIVDSIR